jgi:hypothetical protein
MEHMYNRTIVPNMNLTYTSQRRLANHLRVHPGK